MPHDEFVQVLARTEVFQGLTADELDLFAARCHWEFFQQGESMVKEGEPGAAFHIVIRGQLKVFLPQEVGGREAQRASNVRLNVLREGDCFGEYALIDKRPVSASIEARSAGELLKIFAEDFEAILAAHDRIAKAVYHNLLRILIRRLRAREREYDMLLVAE